MSKMICNSVGEFCSTVCVHRMPHEKDVWHPTCGISIECSWASKVVQCVEVKPNWVVCEFHGDKNCLPFCLHNATHKEQSDCQISLCSLRQSKYDTHAKCIPAPKPFVVSYKIVTSQVFDRAEYCCPEMDLAVTHHGDIEIVDDEPEIAVIMDGKTINFCPFCGAKILLNKV